MNDRMGERARRIATVFGDDLPEQTGDERPEEDASDADASRSDAWLARQVPPHHGG